VPPPERSSRAVRAALLSDFSRARQVPRQWLRQRGLLVRPDRTEGTVECLCNKRTRAAFVVLTTGHQRWIVTVMRRFRRKKRGGIETQVVAQLWVTASFTDGGRRPQETADLGESPPPSCQALGLRQQGASSFRGCLAWASGRYRCGLSCDLCRRTYQILARKCV
jgi:hypothetical protein